MNLYFKLDTSGVDRLVRLADQAFGPGKGDRTVWTQIAAQAAGWMKRSFETRMEGGSADGFSWPRLSGVTALFRTGSKVKRIEDLPGLAARVNPLDDTGMLRNSLVGGREHVRIIRNNGMMVGSALHYAELHQHGGSSALRFTDVAGGDLKLESQRGRQSKNKFLSNHISMKGHARKKKRGRGMTKGWNPEFFRLKGALKKMQGVTRVPRRIVLAPPQNETVRRWFAAVEESIRRKMLAG